jgi:hypothetical protein
MTNENICTGPGDFFSSIKESLQDLHKYQCGSAEHRHDLQKDYNLPDMPPDEHLVWKTVDGIWTNAKDDRTQEQKDEMAEYDRVCDLYADAERDHIWEESSYLASFIISLLRDAKCEHCGNSHSGHGVDKQAAFDYDAMLMSLFEQVAFEIIERGDKVKYSTFDKAALMRTLSGFNPSKEAA